MRLNTSLMDPEAANLGCSKQPMILTHSLMVGFSLVLLIVLEGIIISEVRSRMEKLESIPELIPSHRYSWNLNMTGGIRGSHILAF